MPQARIISLDVFRGLVMAFMVLVENPGNWSIYAPLRHARWGMISPDGLPVHENFTPTDLVMPFFLFIVGVAVVPAFGRAKESGNIDRSTSLRIIRRSGVLFALGILIHSYPSWLNSLLYGEPPGLEILGVLQRIAIVYAISSLVFLRCSAKAIVAFSVAALAGYELLLRLPVPGYPEPQLFRQYFTPGMVPSSFPEWIDAQVLGFANPAGIVSTLSAIVTGLIGVLTGRLLTSNRGSAFKIRWMFIAGTLLLLAGYGWATISCPTIKDLWTPSYTLVSGGYAILCLLLVHQMMNIKQFQSITPPFIAYGMNCIAVYIASHILASTLHVIKITTAGERISLHQWINLHLFESWIHPKTASLAFALTMVMAWLVPLWWMFRQKIFLKV